MKEKKQLPDNIKKSFDRRIKKTALLENRGEIKEAGDEYRKILYRWDKGKIEGYDMAYVTLKIYNDLVSLNQRFSYENILEAQIKEDWNKILK